MKATKLLAVLLAILMVIPAMVFPTAAEEATTATSEYDVVEYRFRTLAESELAYLNSAWPGKTETRPDRTNGRYGEIANGNAGIRYEFPLSSSLMPETITISGNIYNDVWFKISFDGTNWVDGYKATARVNTHDNTFDLTENGNVAVAWENYLIRYGTAPTTMHMWVDNVYFSEMTSGESATGWGTFIANNIDTVVTLKYATDGTQYKYETVVFTPNVDSAPYNYAVDASGVDNPDKDCWYMDEGADTSGTKIIQFAYAMTNSQLPEKLTWTAEIGQNLVIDFSVDNETWKEIYNEVPGNVTTRTYETFDITKDYLAKVAATPSSMLYIRLRSSRPGQGWGGAIGKKPVVLYAGYGEQKISGDYITLDWTPHGQDQSLYYIGGASTSYADKEKTNPIGYYVDANAKATIRYPLANVDLSSEILFTATTSQQLLLEVSLDGTNYVEAFRYNNDSGVAASAGHFTGFSSYKRTFNLTAAVKKAAESATSKSNLYIRFGDAYPGSGYGGRIDYDVTLNVRSADGMEYTKVLSQDVVTGPIVVKETDGDGNPTSYKFSTDAQDINDALPWGDYRQGQFHHTFATNTVDATDPNNLILKGSHDTGWYADNGQYVLRYELPAGLDAWHFTATLTQDIGIYYTYTAKTKKTTPDPQNNFSVYADNMLWNYVDDNNGSRYYGQLTVKAETTKEIYNNGGYLHILIVDYSWWRANIVKEEGCVDNSKGWGPKLVIGQNYPITLVGYAPTESELHNTTNVAYDEYAHTEKESFTLTKVRLSGSKYSIAAGEDGVWDNEDDTYAPYYVIDGVEPVWVGGGALTNTIKDGAFDPETMIFPGDGNYYSRYTDAGYAIYRYEIPEYATAFDWTARVGGDYGIYMMYADSTPSSTDENWTLVRDYLTDTDANGNLFYKVGDHPSATEMTISDKIPADNTAKYVYLMFTDYDYRLYGKYYGDGIANIEGVEEPVLGETEEDWKRADGYGARIALGAEQSVDMVWTLSGKDVDTMPSVKSASLTLTNNFNLNFTLALPVSANDDMEISIKWADGTAANVIDNKDGTYSCVDILPQQMADDLVITFSGSCMDNTKYTSKTFTYSVKDYCQRMISQHSDDAELVALLSDVLAYGAAAQAYVFDDGELATDGVVGMNVSTFEMPTGDYTKVLSDAANKSGDNYKWAGVTLVLDNTVAIRYTIYSYDGTAPVVNVEGKAVELVNDGNGYFHVDVPVMAGNFAKTYTASFEAIEGSSVTYSVNHYVARRYNANTLVTGDLIAALYNYGASAAAYVAAQAN